MGRLCCYPVRLLGLLSALVLMVVGMDVRHPGYVGMIVFSLAIPLLLGSTWALILAVITVFGVIARTAFEGRTLLNELDSYRACAERLNYGLVPGIW